MRGGGALDDVDPLDLLALGGGEPGQLVGEGAPSAVMVWAPDRTSAFLDHVAGDRPHALFHLIAFRGLRRGEACDQRWADTELEASLTTVAEQLVVGRWGGVRGRSQGGAGTRTIALDLETVAVLERHRERQDNDREEWGAGWVEPGRVFICENGAWLHPAKVTRRFNELREEIGLPPIRPHDLGTARRLWPTRRERI